MRPQDEERERAAKSAVRRNLEERCRDCDRCHGGGLVSIFHRRYSGLPFVEIRRRNGQIRKYATRVAVPCTCPLGFWFKEQRENGEATAIRELDLQHAIEGYIPWAIEDPTLPRESPGEVPDWKGLRKRLAEMVPVAREAKPREPRPVPEFVPWEEPELATVPIADDYDDEMMEIPY